MFEEILSRVDHTNLNQQATWKDIQVLCEEAIEYHTASVCIAPSFVKRAKDTYGNKLAVCTVIGFPNGYNTTACKVFETQNAIENGADEIDMVINIGWVKEKNYDAVQDEIEKIKKVCGDKTLKVIIETCLLTDEEKCRMCEVVTNAGAEYIKTSTGFSNAGATFHDVQLFSEHIGKNVKIKAAGGISSMEDAQKFVELGADRLGTSRMIKLVKKQEATGY